MTPRRKRLYVVLGILGGVAASVSLAVMASRENIMFYYDPSQISAGKAPVDKRFRIGGMVVKGSIAHGSMNAKGAFVADEVLAKHDEKYMPPEVAASLKNKEGVHPTAKMPTG